MASASTSCPRPRAFGLGLASILLNGPRKCAIQCKIILVVSISWSYHFNIHCKNVVKHSNVRQFVGIVHMRSYSLYTGTCKFDHILRDLHWLPVHQRIKYKIAMLVNKCLRGLAPPYLAELCQQPSVAGTLLFPVQIFGTAYQPTCVFRHC